MTQFYSDGKYLHGRLPWSPETIESPDNAGLNVFDEPQVVPVLNHSTGDKDSDALEVIYFDPPEPLSAFESTQQQYDGVYDGGAPTKESGVDFVQFSE